MGASCIRFRKNIFQRVDHCFVLIVLLSKIWPSSGQDVDLPLDQAETDAIYKVLRGINSEIEWRSMFAGNLCTDGPHGLICDIYDNSWHVVELNLGWVSNYANNPPCSDNATIDPAILELSRLKKLFFFKCFTKELREIPPEIWRLASSLQHLTFESNSALVGEIPPELGNLTNLERLVLADNSLTGVIPDQIGNLKKLQELLLSHNELKGLIPDTLQNLDNLKILDLSGNQITEGIPSSLGKLTALQKMDLSGNIFIGNIPYELGNLQSLQFLDLSSNRLNGSIPDHLHKLSSLQYLFLGNNLLGGSLPDFWGDFNNLISLTLSNSIYEGGIPDSLGLLHNLNSLALDNNRFVGHIPPLLGNLRSLRYMNLSFNSLTGPIPFSLSFIHRLGNNLNVGNNSGLCYGLSSGMRLSSLELVHSCDSQTSSTPDGSFRAHDHEQLSCAMDNTHAAIKRKLEAIFLLSSAVSLCFSILPW